MGRFKNLKRSRRDDDEDEGGAASDQEVKSSKKTNKKAKKSSADSGKDDDGNSFWSLGGTRRVTLSEFKGKTLVNIREYYTDASGSVKPGKKGISLSLEQYDKLVEALPGMNAELKKGGHEVPALTSAPAVEDEDELAETKSEKKPEKAAKSKKAKANIEATSDEDEDEEEEDD
ncbi:hypothetical protein ABKA04_003775 [Annulohypoxylon sp. FPYF3050]